MKRYLYFIVVAFFLLILMSADIPLFCSSAISKTLPIENLAPSIQEPTSQGEKVTIFFHGLMVGRYKPGKSRLEVGIVKNADDHKFVFQIWEGAGEPKDINIPHGGPYEFDVVYNDGSSSEGALVRYRPQGANFDRMNSTYAGNAVLRQDYRYIADIEGDGLHEKKLRRRKKSFNYVFHVLSGVLKSKCLTDDIIQKKKPGDATYIDYGFIAEIVGVDITLLPNQKLVLRKKGETIPLWSCSYSIGKTIEARVLHLPEKRLIQARQAKSGQRSDYISEACKEYPDENPNTSHFKLYYTRVLNVAESDRFDLKSRGKKRAIITTIFPYKCGMILQGKTGTDIDASDISPPM